MTAEKCWKLTAEKCMFLLAFYNSKSRNPDMQTMLRLVGFGDNAGSGFPTILDVWKSEGWVEPQLIEDANLNQ